VSQPLLHSFEHAPPGLQLRRYTIESSTGDSDNVDIS
jgi:hypothetical protein